MKGQLWITRTQLDCGLCLVMFWMAEGERWMLWKWRTEQLPVIRY